MVGLVQAQAISASSVKLFVPAPTALWESLIGAPRGTSPSTRQIGVDDRAQLAGHRAPILEQIK
jgi:hypothetical protein